MAVNMSNQQKNKSLSYQSLMALTALGVVYGDIGTSPLYALKEAFFAQSYASWYRQHFWNSLFGVLGVDHCDHFQILNFYFACRP